MGPGLAGIDSGAPDLPAGVAFLIDPDRDPQLAHLFHQRDSLDEQSFLATWDPAPPQIHVQAFPAPHAPEALIAYTIRLTQPTALTRTLLLLASTSQKLLPRLNHPDTNLWLLSKQAATQAWAAEGAATGRQVYDHALPLGAITHPTPAHPGHPQPPRPPAGGVAGRSGNRSSIRRLEEQIHRRSLCRHCDRQLGAARPAEAVVPARWSRCSFARASRRAGA